MAKINFVAEGKPRQSDWSLVAKVWPHKSKADAFSGKFGVKVKDTTGELKDSFSEITLKPGDPIMIRPNQNRRTGKNDPAYLIFVLKEGAKAE